MKTLTILIFCLISIISEKAGDDINFKPRLLLKELGNLSGDQDFQILEIHFNDPGYDIKGKFFEVSCKDKSNLTVYIGRVNSCRSGGCSNQISQEETNSEFFDYFIVFDSEKKIKTIRVYNYEATHGQEITVKGWLNQFLGYDGTASLRVGKEIDAIAGATISVFGLIADVQEKTSMLKSLTTAQAAILP
jgi:hypothetical protein